MTRQKSFKARVRARMEKTGESYTAARRQLLAKSGEGEETSAAGVETPVEPDRRGVAAGEQRLSDEALRGRTGRGWEEWFALLDEWGAAERSHRDIARWLSEEHGVEGWSAQSVTVAYEQARGLRAPGEGPEGFTVSASKTVVVPIERLFEAFDDEKVRERWLPGAPLEVTTARPGKSLRGRWDGSTRIVVGFTAKGDEKSQVALAHERLPDADAAAEMKAYWRERVAALKELLER